MKRRVYEHAAKGCSPVKGGNIRRIVLGRERYETAQTLVSAEPLEFADNLPFLRGRAAAAVLAGKDDEVRPVN